MNSYSKYHIVVVSAAVVAIVALIAAKLLSFDSVIHDMIRPVVVTSAASKKPIPEPTNAATKAQLPAGFSYRFQENGKAPALANSCAPIKYVITKPPSSAEQKKLIKDIDTVGDRMGLTFKQVSKLGKQPAKPATTYLRFEFISDEDMKNKYLNDESVKNEYQNDIPPGYSPVEQVLNNRSNIPTIYDGTQYFQSTYAQNNSEDSTDFVYVAGILLLLGFHSTDNFASLISDIINSATSDTDKQALNALVRTCPA